MNHYEEKQEARRQRLEARAERLTREANARIESGMDRLRAIPFGQPILVGHHSEKRDRNYRSKAVASVDKGMELRKVADDVAARAAAIGTGGISSDDPEAVKKLKAELAEKEARHAAIKARSHESWELSNSSANIRRIKQRIEALTKATGRETKSEELAGGIKLVENAEANRVQIIFSGKPSADVRAKLKTAGFRWSPSEGAWQRQLNSSAVYWARDLIAKIGT